MEDNKYVRVATLAEVCWKSGRPYPSKYGVDFPPPGKTGLCGRGARAMWEEVHKGKPFPYRSGTALGMFERIKRAGKMVLETANGNAFHTAVGLQIRYPERDLFKPGTMVFLPYSKWGHVVTVIAIDGELKDPTDILKRIHIFENTSAGPPRGPGNSISTLAQVCGAQGSSRIIGCAFIP